METRKLFVLTLSLLCCIPLAKTQSFACSCSKLKPCENFGLATAVFIGQMLGGTERTDRVINGVKYSFEAGELTFAVEEIFKGVQGKEVKVLVDSEKWTSCEWSGLVRGVRYLIYAGSVGNQLVIGPCTPKIEVEAGAAKDHLDFLRSLPAEGSGGRIYGRAWLGDEQTPIANVTITVQGENGDRSKTTTDDAGRYEFDALKPGRYIVEYTLDAGYRAYAPIREAIVSDRGCVIIDFPATITGYIGGRVTEVGKWPVSVSIYLVSSEDENKTISKVKAGVTDGKFDFAHIPAGRYLLYAYNEIPVNEGVIAERYFYPGVSRREQATVISVERGQTVTGIEFPIPIQNDMWTIIGRVEWSDGSPAEMVDVALIEEMIDGVESSSFEPRILRATINKTGGFTLSGLKGVTYRVEAHYLSTVGSGESNEPIRVTPQRINADQNIGEIKLILSRN